MFCRDIKLFSPDRLIAPFYLYSNEEEVFSSNFLLQMQNRYLTGPAPEFSAPNLKWLVAFSRTKGCSICLAAVLLILQLSPYIFYYTIHLFRGVVVLQIVQLSPYIFSGGNGSPPPRPLIGICAVMAAFSGIKS